jgi:hypothetical protein
MVFAVEHVASQLVPDVERWLLDAAGRALVGRAGEELPSPAAAGAMLAINAYGIMSIAVLRERCGMRRR